MNDVATASALTVIDRARAALKVTPERDAELTTLAQRSAGIVTITNKAGYDECHAARMVLKNERVAIGKDGKTARDDAVTFSKAVIAEEARLIAFIEPEEKRLQALQDAEDERVEAAKQARLRAEADRIALINKRLEWIRGQVVELAGKPSAEVLAAIDNLETIPVTAEHYAEFIHHAQEALDATLAKLRAMREQAVANEAEAARLAEQKRKLDEQQAALDREDAERKERNAREDAERAYLIAWDDAHREHVQRVEDAGRAFLIAWDDAIREDAQRVEDAEHARLAKIEEDRAAAERAEREAQERAASEKRRNDREALEIKADPWAAIYLAITTLAGIDYFEDTRLALALETLRAAFGARDELAALDAAGKPAEAAEAGVRG